MLFLTHEFLSFLQTVRLTLDVDHGAVMQYMIQDGGDNGNIGSDLIPLGEGLVGGEDGGGFLIPSGDQLEEQVCALDIHREIAGFVDDEHPVLGENLELIRQTVLKVGLLELFNELVAVFERNLAGGVTSVAFKKSSDMIRPMLWQIVLRKRFIAMLSRLDSSDWEVL